MSNQVVSERDRHKKWCVDLKARLVELGFEGVSVHVDKIDRRAFGGEVFDLAAAYVRIDGEKYEISCQLDEGESLPGVEMFEAGFARIRSMPKDQRPKLDPNPTYRDDDEDECDEDE